MIERDRGFIIDSWVRSFRRSHWCGVLSLGVYNNAHRQYFAEVIDQRATVLVAVNPAEDNPQFEIFGYLVYEQGTPPIVHWVYVKAGGYREKHIASYLLYMAGIRVKKERFIATCWTMTATKIRDALRARGEILQIDHDPRYLRDEGWKR